jgi:hypothetical protein
LLFLPLIAVAAAKVSGGGMTTRYMLPAVLGGAMAVAYLANRLPVGVRVLVLAVMLMNYGLTAVGPTRAVVKGSGLERRAAAASEVESLLALGRRLGLPTVVSSGLEYLPMAYYRSQSRAFSGQEQAAFDMPYALTDAPAALEFGKTDSVDLALLSLRRYFALNVEDFGEFAGKHREFLLVASDGVGFDWWPARLVHDGHAVQLVAVSGKRHVYRVTLKSR